MARIPQRSAKPMKAHPFFNKGGSKLSPEQVKAQFQKLYDAGNYAQALPVVVDFATQNPRAAQAWSDAAACCVHLQQWQLAVEYGMKCYLQNPDVLAAIDALSHAYENLGDWDNTRKFGLLSLQKRDKLFGQKLFSPWESQPSLPLSHTRTRNIIAFSLFGGNSKYCETAILNVLEQPTIYPQWMCRFYIDDSVPVAVQERLITAGAQVIKIPEAMAHWPGPMWRFAAYDDPQVERVIFRDADSVISTREAGAVAQWIESGQPFHMMRDGGSHTELILAGLWGVTRGAMPPMTQMVQDYLKTPPESMHFADQYFLREYVWPYTRGHIMQHDSLFGFLEYQPFPEGAHRTDFHTGCTDSSPYFEVPVQKPDGASVTWGLWDSTQTPEKLICRYAATVHNARIRAHLPKRYADKINQGYTIRLE